MPASVPESRRCRVPTYSVSKTTNPGGNESQVVGLDCDRIVRVQSSRPTRPETEEFEMGIRTMLYSSREEMYRGVECLSDQGWMLSGLKKLPGGILEATFSVKSSVVTPWPGETAGYLSGSDASYRASGGAG